MPKHENKINVYLEPKEGQDIIYQSGQFDYKDFGLIITKDSLLYGSDIQVWNTKEDLPGNKTKFIYHLKGYVDFTWEHIVVKSKEESTLKKMFNEMKDELKIELTKEIKKSEENVKAYVDVKIEETKAYVDEKVSECETNVKAYVDVKITESETRIKDFVKEQIDNHVRDYH